MYLLFHSFFRFIGLFTIASPTMTSYKHVYHKCNLSNLIVVEKGFYCNFSHRSELFMMKAHLRVKISIITQSVTMYLEGHGLEALERMTEEQFLKLLQGKQIKMLTPFRISKTWVFSNFKHTFICESNLIFFLMQIFYFLSIRGMSQYFSYSICSLSSFINNFTSTSIFFLHLWLTLDDFSSTDERYFHLRMNA